MPLSPPRRRLTRGLCWLSALLLATSCDPEDYPSFPGFPGCIPLQQVKVQIQKKKDLKLVPLANESDSLKLGVANYRDPSATVKPPKDPRLTLTGTADNSGGFVYLDRLFEGAYDLQVRVGHAARTGFDEQFGSTGQLHVHYPDSGPVDSFFDIQYQIQPLTEGSEPAGNVQIFVFDKDNPGGGLGPETIFEGVNQADLRIRQTATEVTWFARPVPPATTEGDGWIEIISVAQPQPEFPFRVGLGAFGLDKGGRIYFDGMSLAGDGLVQGDELALAAASFELGNDLQIIIDFLESLADPGDVSAALASALAATEALEVDLDLAIDGDTLESLAGVPFALKNIECVKKQIQKAIDRLPKALEQLELDKPKLLEAVIALLGKAVECNCVLVANIGGLPVRKPSDLPLEPVVPEGDV